MPFPRMRDWLGNAWKWIQALWDKHDDSIQEMVQAILPLVIEVTFRNDLSGEQKKKAIVDAVLDRAGAAADKVSGSMLNEVVEIAVNKYNIQVGKLTLDKIDASRAAVLKAGRDFANGELKLTGKEAEDAGLPPAQ